MSRNYTSKGDSYYQKEIGLNSVQSIDGDSLPDYSEFDTESVAMDYFKESDA